MQFEKIIEIADGLFYEVPVSEEIETLYINLPKSEQYWKRQDDFPQFFFDYNPHLIGKEKIRINASKTNYVRNKLVTLSVEDTIEVIRLAKREKERMTKGIYIMNNGKKIYFPGIYYGALQWGCMFGVKSGDGYGEHRKYQRIFSYVHQMAETIDELIGYYCHKAKKTGITQLLALFILIKFITEKQFTAAAMSKVLGTAKGANFKYFLYALKKIPHVLRPTIEQRGWEGAVQKIEATSADIELSVDNLFQVVPTTTDGLDGLPKQNIVHIDEPPKHPKNAPIEQTFEKSKEQVNPQGVKGGVIAMTSYPPEEDTDAFFWCKDFYNNSCKIVNGKPLNGVIPFFIGIGESMTGTFDKYGEPNIVKALSIENAERAKCKNNYELQARKRQYPMTAKEGWEVGGGGSVFDNETLSKIEEELEYKYLNGELNYSEFDLEWSEGRFSKVNIRFLTHEEKMSGKSFKWRLYCDVSHLEGKTNLCFDMPRKIKYINKERHFLLQPHSGTLFAGAIDPVDYAYVDETSGNLSKNVSIIKDLEGNLISEYVYRDNDPDTALDDFCKEMVFFGHYNLIEGNRKDAFTTIEKQGLCFFLLVRHPNGEILPYKERVSIKPVSSSKDIISKYVSAIVKKIRHKPFQLKSLRCIKQLKVFDSTDTKKTDIAVCEGLSEIAVEAVQNYVLSKKSKENRNAYMGRVLENFI